MKFSNLMRAHALSGVPYLKAYSTGTCVQSKDDVWSKVIASRHIGLDKRYEKHRLFLFQFYFF